MARRFEELREKMSPARRAKVAAMVADTSARLHLAELRRARQLTQVQLAKRLGIAQSEVSRIEHRTDMHLSTLGNAIEAMGGRLRLIADFGDDAVELTQLSDDQLPTG
jgi:DNA-binding XRE family transcriptional regulator